MKPSTDMVTCQMRFAMPLQTARRPELQRPPGRASLDLLGAWAASLDRKRRLRGDARAGVGHVVDDAQARGGALRGDVDNDVAAVGAVAEADVRVIARDCLDLALRTTGRCDRCARQLGG